MMRQAGLALVLGGKSIDEAAAAMGIHRSTVYRAVAANNPELVRAMTKRKKKKKRKRRLSAAVPG